MIETTGIIVVAVLLIAGSAALSKALRVPSPLVLLVVGALIGFLPMLPAVEVPSDVILTGILPPLLYAAALNVPLRDFRRNLGPIFGLSVLLVVISALLVGFLVAALLPGIGLAMAIALGAVVAPTDAVAATSIARRLGLPERLVTVLEGESLVNDATALVLLRTATAAAAAGAFSAGDVALDFGWAVLGGILVGGAIGAAATLLRRRMTDPVLTTIVSFAVPFAAFIPAEEVGASGVLAVVVAGLVVGHTARRKLSAQQRITERNIWETVQFVLEQGVFLLMGLELSGLVEELEDTGGGLLAAVGTGLLVVLLLIAVRTVFVAGLLFVQRRLEARQLEREAALPAIQERVDRLDDSDPRMAGRKRRVQRRLDSFGADMRFLRTQGLSRRGGLVLSWAGMRGVVTLAAAQTLTGAGLSPAESAFLIMVAFTVAVTTLFGLGGTLDLVIRASGVQRAPDGEREIAELMRRLADASLAALDDPAVLEVDGRTADPAVVDRLRRRYTRPDTAADEAASDLDSIRTQQIVLMQRMRDAAREELLDAQSTSDFSSHAIRGAQQLLDIDDARAARRLGG